MKTETINGHTIEFYSSIRDVPEWKWQLMQQLIMQVEYIGSTLEDVTKHFARFDVFMRNKMYDELLEERINLTFNFNGIINGINPKSKALVCLISSIDGEKVDISKETALNDAHQKLLDTDISNGQLDDLLGELKKKLLMISDTTSLDQ